MRCFVLNDLLIRMRALFRGKPVEAQLDEELRFHLERQAEKYVRSGMSREEATRRARVEFGGIELTKEECRDARGVRFIETLHQDVRYGLRMLRKSPGFTAAVVLTLTLGIGLTTAIFSVVYGIVFRPLPYGSPERLVAVWLRSVDEPGDEGRVSMPDFKDWQTQNSVFESLAAYGYNRYDLREEQGGESVRAAMVSPDFFATLGVRPLFGRELGPADERERVAVLSHQLWQDLYHGEKNAIGKTIRLGDHDFTVIGVMPRSFRLPTPDVSLWLSLADIYATSGNPSVGNWITDRGLHGYGVIGRLKKGVRLPQAQTQMDALEARLAQSFPKNDKGLMTMLVPLQKQVVGDVQLPLLLFLGAVAFVLLIACANVANLLLSKATVRNREMAVRRALGGETNRLVRQVLTESALFGVLGGGLGVLLAFWLVDLFLTLTPQTIPRLQDVRVDWTVLIFALITSLAASMLFGMAPAIRVRGLEVYDFLREGGRGVGENSHSRALRSALAACEIALAMILAVGAGLMLRSFIRLTLLEAGFAPDHLQTFDVVASLDRYPQPSQQVKFFNEILGSIRALPGVKSAGACTSMPPDITQESDSFSLPGRTSADPEKSPDAWYLPATPGFLGTLGVPLLAGRDFRDSDDAGSARVAIINEHIVREYFKGEDPLGQKIDFRGAQRTIIGVAGNTTYSGLGAPPEFQIYVPYPQGAFPGLHFAIRPKTDALNLAAAVRSAIKSVDSQARATRFSTMEHLLSGSIVQPRFYAWLLALLGFVALLLAALGIFGVLSYSVSQRTHEIGVRMALGAERRDVLVTVVGYGLKLALVGIGAGIVGSMAVTRVLSSLLYGIKPSDVTTFIAVSLLVTGVALLASYIPARRAMRLDPIVALRYQ